MKWTTTKKALDDDTVPSDERDHFIIYETKGELEEDIKDPEKYEKWVTFTELPEKRLGNRKSQRKYEIYCGGYLFYHDKEFKRYQKGNGFYYISDTEVGWKKYPEVVDGIKTEKFEHAIYFDWQVVGTGKSKTITLTIHITKTPDALNPVPPQPPPPPPPES